MDMRNRLIITDGQLKRLERSITENVVYDKMVNKIVNDLNINYEPSVGVMRKGGEYFEEPMVKIKVDGEMITPKALYDYLMFKYKLGSDFTKQLITDWLFGSMGDGNKLSKNVPLM